MGNLKINFKETIGQEIKDSHEIKTEIKPSVFEEFVLTLGVMPLKNENAIEEKNDVMIMFDKVPEFDAAWN